MLAEGDVIVRGLDISRRAAGYNANRALFQLLLSAPYHSKAKQPAIAQALRFERTRRPREGCSVLRPHLNPLPAAGG